jgi:hypothetical protein
VLVGIERRSRNVCAVIISKIIANPRNEFVTFCAHSFRKEHFRLPYRVSYSTRC